MEVIKKAIESMILDKVGRLMEKNKYELSGLVYWDSYIADIIILGLWISCCCSWSELVYFVWSYVDDMLLTCLTYLQTSLSP